MKFSEFRYTPTEKYTIKEVKTTGEKYITENMYCQTHTLLSDIYVFADFTQWNYRTSQAQVILMRRNTCELHEILWELKVV